MNTLIRSSVFSDWLNGLKDQKAKARILHRLSQASLGNFGDCEPAGEGVSEMRIHHGPGFRVFSCVMVPPSMCCLAVATSRAGAATSPGQSAWRGN